MTGRSLDWSFQQGEHGMEDQDALMIGIARKRVSDEEVMEALMQGSAGGDVAPRPPAQRTC